MDITLSKFTLLKGQGFFGMILINGHLVTRWLFDVVQLISEFSDKWGVSVRLSVCLALL